MFSSILTLSNQFLDAGDVAWATKLLDRAWELDLTAHERKLAHDHGNKIQRVIFEQYSGE